MKILLSIATVIFLAWFACKYIGEYIRFNQDWQREVNARRKQYERENAAYAVQRVKDSIETVRYCERADSMIRDLKEVTRKFNVLSRWPDNVTQKEYDEIMNGN